MAVRFAYTSDHLTRLGLLEPTEGNKQALRTRRKMKKLVD